jgi:class 3 adenylate cyclase
MAIFAGDDKNTRATRASLALNWGVHQVISPAMHRAWSDIDRYYTMQHAIGVDTGQALIVRGGVFGDSDMISVGSAPNIAAKLSEIRNRYSILVTEDVYQGMSDEVTYAAQPSWPYAQVDMWAPLGQCNIGGKVVWVRGSTYWWEPEV